MKRRTPPMGAGLYVWLIEDRARRHADWVERLGCEVGHLRAWLEGVPLELHGWELPGRLSDFGVTPNDRVVVHPDDRIEVVLREHGDRVGVVELRSERWRRRGFDEGSARL